MPQYLVAIHHPDNYDPSLEDEAMVRDIDVLNEEMAAAGARFFAGGLQSAPRAKSLRKRPGGEVVVTDGPYLETKEHIGGFQYPETSHELLGLKVRSVRNNHLAIGLLTE